MGLAGFLIALFYSNLSGVFSSKYANLDFSIAKAVIEEPENRKSLSGITNYVIINVLLLALSVFSMEYRGIMACCFLMYTLYIIVAFMHISKRIFVFNNLNSITCLEIKKIQVSYSCQDIDNIYWQNRLFRAKKSFDSLRRLLEHFIYEKDFNALVEFEKSIIVLLSDYADIKGTIPYDSCWFDEKIMQKSLLQMDGTELSVYVDSGVIPRPSRVKNNYWFEEKIFDMIEQGVKALIINKRDSYVIEVFSTLYTQTADFFKHGIEERILCLEKSLFKTINLLIEKHFDEEDVYFKQSILDIELALMAVNISNIADYLRECELSIERIDFDNYKFDVLLKNNLSLYNNEKVKHVTKQVDLEKEIEGRRITDDKFLREQLYALLYEETDKAMNVYKGILKRLNDFVSELISQGKCKQAEIIVARNMNMITEIERNFKIMEKQKVRAEKFELDFKWGQTISQLTAKQIDEIKLENIINGMKIVEMKNCVPRKENEIDIYGMVLYHSYLLAHEFLIKEDFEGLKRVHKHLLAVKIKCANAVRHEIEWNEYNTNYVSKQYAKLFIYFMNLEGKMVFLSRLNSNQELEKMVVEQLEGLKEDKSFMNCLVECGRISHSILFIGDSILSSQNRRFEDKIRNMENIKFKIDDFHLSDQIDFEDEIVSKFKLGRYDFLEIYLCYYINQYATTKFEATNRWNEKA